MPVIWWRGVPPPIFTGPCAQPATLTSSFPRIRKTAARVLRALAELPYGLAGAFDPETISKRPVTIVGDDPRVDILTVAWDVTYERAEKSMIVRRIAGIRVPYLGLEDLVRSKRTGRAADLADIEVLRGSRRVKRKTKRR